MNFNLNISFLGFAQPLHYNLAFSLISLAGVLTLAMKKSKLESILIFLVSFAVGGLLGGAFIHLLPEIVEKQGFTISVSLSLLSGILVFFVLEKFIHWRHCHVPTSKKHPHPLAVMNLVGDGFHNFIDGMIIAGSYLVAIPIGITTTVAVILHEIPQEIGDFGVLLYAGFSKKKALFFNFLSALTAVLGAGLTLTIGKIIPNFSLFIVPFTAGGFIYIAGSDLIPELHKQNLSASRSIVQFLALVLGILIMLSMVLLE